MLKKMSVLSCFSLAVMSQENIYLPHELKHTDKELPPTVYTPSSSKKMDRYRTNEPSHRFQIGLMLGPIMRGHQGNILPLKYSSIGCFFKGLAGINYFYKSFYIGADLYAQTDVGASKVDRGDVESAFYRYLTVGIMPKIGYYIDSTLCFLGLGLEGSYDYLDNAKKLINFYLAPSTGIEWSLSQKMNLRFAYQFSWTPSKRSFGFDSRIGKIRSLSHSIGVGFILKI